MSAPSSAQCEVLVRLQAELEAMALALRKANDILALAAESPDTIRRRRNSIKRWHEVYGIAHERLMAHTREHNCTSQSPASEA